MRYEYLEDVGIADIFFRARGRDLEDLFRACAEATMNVMVQDLDTIQPRQELQFELHNESLDLLLFDFLQELIYHKDATQLLLRVGAVTIREEASGFSLKATARGEKLNPRRHEQGVDVKAVTLHRFSLEQTAQGWQAGVLLDI